MTENKMDDRARKRLDPSEPSMVVGLGASAGGVVALQQFFGDMPPKSGIAFVVVMHLSPDHESQLANVIQQTTAMPVIQVNEPVEVRSNHVYVIPPNHQLTFQNSTLHLLDPQQEPGRRVTIDLFFRTLAQAYGQRAVCVILSGSDSDGVIGLKHIRAQGGVTVAQDPEEAEFNSMPVSAIATGMVDWILPVAEMPVRLMELVRNENAMRLLPEIPEAEEPDVKVENAPGGETIAQETRHPDDESAIVEILKQLRKQTGHDFSHYKRATVLRRIARRLQVNSLDSIPRYLDFLRKHPMEASALLHDLLIGVTHFFRDQEAFAALEAHIPQLFAGKKREEEIRVWVAGCATGEEAYSIAILLSEHSDRLASPPPVLVFATDIDEQAVEDAREGIYPSTIEADVSQERLRRFFKRNNGHYEVQKDLRDKVLFAEHNLLADPPFSRVDLVACRNLLIYLNRRAQDQIFDLFHFALRAGGLLFIGGAETGDNVRSLFSPVDARNRLYVRRSLPRPTWRLPPVPVRAQRLGLRPRPRRPILPPMSRQKVEEAGGDSEESAGQERRSVLFGELHLKLLEHYGPPSVVINEAYDIVHLSEHAGRYLTFRAGEPSTNLIHVVHPSLRVELRTALFRASQTNENIIAAGQQVQIDGGTELIDLHVRPIHPEDAAHGFFLVLFEKQTTPPGAEAARSRDEAVTRELGDELQSLKDQLNATVEQYEASGEELKASNEELQAMNEEMRSAAEELETSKEELQSINEELVTVNQELKDKVEEVSRVNSDMQNLMSATDIGTIFLDRQLRTERFTPAVQQIFNLLPSDVGRPIADITHKLRYERLIADAEQVLDRLVPIEHEIPAGDNRWFLARIAPYRTMEDKISGVVLTFTEITGTKRAEAKLRESEARLRRAIEIRTIGVFFFSVDGRITDANDAFLTMSGYTREDLKAGRVRWDQMTPPEWLRLTRDEMDRFSRTGKIGPYEKQYIRKDETRWWGLFTGTKLTEEFGVEYVLDISDKKQAEKALRESEERFRAVADNIPEVIWTNEPEGNPSYFNKRWYDYTGLSYEESIGPGWQNVIHPDDKPALLERWQQALAGGEVFNAEYRLLGRDGNYRWFIGRNVPLRENGKILGWFGSATDIDDFKRAEAALRESDERFRLLVEGARDYAIFLLDPSNTIVYWSAGAERVFGWSAQQAIGQSGELVFTPEDRATKQEEKEIETALRRGVASDRRWHIRKDGRRIWVDGVMRRLDDEKTGALRGFAKIARDATKQRAAEEELHAVHLELEKRVRERTVELQAKNRQLRQEMERRQILENEILRITDRERARISQDLHDSVCQELTATAFLLNSEARKISKQTPECAEALREAAETVNLNAGRARDFARGLHPFELESTDLTSALRELAGRTNEKVPCQFESRGNIRRLDNNLALNVYRITQEAVTNVIKHAEPSAITIKLESKPGEIVLLIKDDGKGFAKNAAGKGMGIHLMKYRANALGGTFAIDSRRGRGTTVTCKIPAKS